METIQASTLDYENTKDHDYYNAKDRERRLEAHFDRIQADDTLEITQALEASVKESLARKQALKDEWVSIDKTWLKATERKDWENTKSSLDSSKPCKMSVKERKKDALKHYKQRAVKKCKRLGIEYKVEYIKSLRNGKLIDSNAKELFVRRKHLGLFFNENKGYLKISLLRNRQVEAIEKFGVDNYLQEKLKKHNIQYFTYLNRVRQGWSVERAASTPPINRNTKRFLKMYPHRALEIKDKKRGRKCK